MLLSGAHQLSNNQRFSIIRTGAPLYIIFFILSLFSPPTEFTHWPFTRCDWFVSFNLELLLGSVPDTGRLKAGHLFCRTPPPGLVSFLTRIKLNLFLVRLSCGSTSGDLCVFNLANHSLSWLFLITVVQIPDRTNLLGGS